MKKKSAKNHLLRDLNVKFLLNGNENLDSVKTVQVQVLGEGSSRGDLKKKKKAVNNYYYHPTSSSSIYLGSIGNLKKNKKIKKLALKYQQHQPLTTVIPTKPYLIKRLQNSNNSLLDIALLETVIVSAVSSGNTPHTGSRNHSRTGHGASSQSTRRGAADIKKSRSQHCKK